MKRIEFHPETEAEFAHHLDFYREKAAGLAAEFVDAVDQAVTFVRGNPEAGSPASGELRRWRVRRFSFTVIYREALRDAVRCHYDEGQAPAMIRLRYVREEVFAA